VNRNDYVDTMFGKTFRERCRQGKTTRQAKPVNPKSKWAKFRVGQTVSMRHPNADAPHIVKVAAIYPDGLLLRGKGLPPVLGKSVEVNSVACRVYRISSKGLYVRGA